MHQNNILIYIQQDTLHSLFYLEIALHVSGGRGQLKCDGTRAETRFRLSAKRTSPFTWRKRQFSRLLAADVCASAIVLLDIPCSEVVWRILVTHSIRQFPLHFPSLALPCAITFQLDSTKHSTHSIRQFPLHFPSHALACAITFQLDSSYKFVQLITGLSWHYDEFSKWVYEYATAQGKVQWDGNSKNDQAVWIQQHVEDSINKGIGSVVVSVLFIHALSC